MPRLPWSLYGFVYSTAALLAFPFTPLARSVRGRPALSPICCDVEPDLGRKRLNGVLVLSKFRRMEHSQMKRKTFLFVLVTAFLMMFGTCLSYGQKGSGGQTGSGGGASGGSQTGGNSGGAGTSQSASSSGSGQSTRIESTMLAYEASDKIAAQIATEVTGHTLYIYDGQSFAAIQAYDAYDATVGVFETGFNLFLLPGSSFVAAAPAVQQIASTIGSLRSSAEYSAQTVDFQTDPIIAQVASHLTNTSVIVPKMLLLDDDLASPAAAQVMTSGCADISKTIPAQLACLLQIRNAAFKQANAASTGTQNVADPNKAAAFTQLDKLFQVFFGTLMGTSVNLSGNSANATPHGQGGGDPPQGPGNAGGPSNQSPGANQSGAVPEFLRKSSRVDAQGSARQRQSGASPRSYCSGWRFKNKAHNLGRTVLDDSDSDVYRRSDRDLFVD